MNSIWMVNYTKEGTKGTRLKAIEFLKLIKNNHQYVKNNCFQIILDTLTIQKIQEEYPGENTSESVKNLIYDVLNIKTKCFVCEKDIESESLVYHHILYSRNDLYGNGVTVPVHKIECHGKAYQFNCRTEELRKYIWRYYYDFRTLVEAENNFREFMNNV